MQKRHFVVREVDGNYQIKEVDAGIAKAMSLFGINKGEYQNCDFGYEFFYFCPVTARRASELAEQLIQQIPNSA